MCDHCGCREYAPIAQLTADHVEILALAETLSSATRYHRPIDSAGKARLLRSHGMVRQPGGDPWWYEMPELGFNYRIPDVLCALGLSQLNKLDRFVARRRELTALYARLLPERAPKARLAASPAHSNPALHLLTVLIACGGFDHQARRT